MLKGLKCNPMNNPMASVHKTNTLVCILSLLQRLWAVSCHSEKETAKKRYLVRYLYRSTSRDPGSKSTLDHDRSCYRRRQDEEHSRLQYCYSICDLTMCSTGSKPTTHVLQRIQTPTTVLQTWSMLPIRPEYLTNRDQ